MTFLIHPQHGATNAGGADIEPMKKAGWLVSNPAYWLSLKGKEFKAPKDESDTGEVATIEEQHDRIFKDAPKNKGGRPRKVV